MRFEIGATNDGYEFVDTLVGPRGPSARRWTAGSLVVEDIKMVSPGLITDE